MKWLLHNKRLTLTFRHSYVSCNTVSYYQANEILSFAILDLAFKIIKQRKRKFVILKKRKPIIHLLNYIDALNFNSKKFSITISFKNNYETLTYALYSHRSKYFDNF